MRRIAILGLVLICGAIPAEGQASSCLPADASAQRMVNALRALVTSTAPQRVDVRNSLGLQVVAASSVVQVVDKATCDKVVTGMNTQLGTRNLVRQLYVVKVGSDYAAQDPGHPAGEWIPLVTFDGKKFRFKGVILSL